MNFWPFRRGPKPCPHYKRDLSVICDKHTGCRTCKRQLGAYPCGLIAIRGVPTIPDVPYPPVVKEDAPESR